LSIVISAAGVNRRATFKLKGEDEQRAKASAFLLKAFGT
jgi:hypothetical protein